ncbi:MAG: hypothetical protein JWR00_2174 [Rubritepida sp.]|nr:hypothetical protein [Rubritepida sp.]
MKAWGGSPRHRDTSGADLTPPDNKAQDFPIQGEPFPQG